MRLHSERDNGIGDCFDYVTINFVDMTDNYNLDNKRCFKFIVSSHKYALDKHCGTSITKETICDTIEDAVKEYKHMINEIGMEE